jgi:bla regulator protein BlaR1
MMARAICWTLVHSLWQGMLAAVLAGIIILLTRKSSPAVRHNLLAATLLLFLGVAGVTFWWEFRQAAATQAAVGAMGRSVAVRDAERTTPDAVLSTGQPESNWQITQSSTSSALVRRITGEVNEHASTIALVWMFFLFGQLIRMAAGLYQIGRIRQHGKLPPTDVWMEKLGMLSAQLGIKRRVSLLQTGSVSVPAVIGLLTPAILLPIGMLAHLPPDQLETVLLHELAHIKRNDLLTNLLLYFAEIVFFFNPGLRWLCSLIRREREACCDDIVLERTPDKTTYFEALVAFQQFAAGGRGFALQLAGGRSDLLWRMKRMLSEENKKLQLMEKTFLSFGLIALVAVGLLSMKTGDKRTPQPVSKQTLQAADYKQMQKPDDFSRMAATSPKMDTIPDTSLKAKTGNDKKRKFPSITMNTNRNEKGNLITLQGTDKDGNKYFFQKINDKVIKISINGKVIPEEEYHKYLYLFDEIEGEWGEATKPAMPAPPAVTVRGMGAIPALPATPTMMADSVEVHRPNYDYFGHVIYDLRADGLIQSNDPLSYTLDKDGLVVNGAKQTEAIYQKYKAKYLKDPADHVIYTHEGGHWHTDVWMENK